MSAEPRIAIVGIGGLFPGSHTLDEFWQIIVNGVDSSRDVPPGRWLLDPADAIASGTAVEDHVPHSRAYYLDEIPCDTAGLNLDAGLFRQLDPVFHLILHAGVQAFRDAKTESIDRQRVGVILGHIALPTQTASALAVEILGRAFLEKLGVENNLPHVEPLNRYVAGLPAGILAKALGLGGGSFTLDAACASSLYALKLAADELRAGRADLMLTGGAARPDCLYTQMGFAQLHALSPSGRCSPFDAAGDGLMVGEGCGVVALKRLDDALRDGDYIHATIAGIGLSNDVEGGLLAPASEGQLRAMRAAYAQAGWSPSDIDLIECHATGTPVGDAVEFSSLEQLWRAERCQPGQCTLGSVKSSVGHLLTGAGSAGLIKLLLALKYETLPPTANFRKPSPRIHLDRSPFQVRQKAAAWKRRGNSPRRCAISGFGFGGINAHVLLEEHVEGETCRSVVVRNEHLAGPVAIIGMGARFGPWQSLAQVRDRLFARGESFSANVPTSWWGVEQSDWLRHQVGRPDQCRGYFIDEIRIPADQFRIPPRELEEMLPQQLLALQTSAAALADAGEWEKDRARAGVFLGLGLDLNTTNYHFRWWALEAGRAWRRSHPGNLDEPGFSEWLQQLRDAAHPGLNANRTMGALGSIAGSRIARAFQFAGSSFTICSEETSGGRALEMAVRALQRHDLDLALTGAVDLAGDVRAVLGSNSANIPGEGAAIFVLKRLSDARRDGNRVYGVIRGVGVATDDSTDSIALKRALADANTESFAAELVEKANAASTAAQIGNTGAASFAASLVKACLALHHQVLPLGDRPRFWLTNRAEGPRRAVVSGTSVDGNCVYMLLEEHPKSNAEPVFISGREPGVFPLNAESASELVRQLDRLQQLATDGPIHQLAARWRRSAAPEQSGRCRLVLVAGSAAELREAIAAARIHLLHRSDWRVEGEWADRIRYSPAPLRASGKLALVFPGSGNHFFGMGRELAARFPAVLQRQQSENQRLRDQFAPDHFWHGESGKDVDPIHAMFGQVALGGLVTDLLAQFEIKPDAAIGYSLGESAALFATRAWKDRDEMFRRMSESSLFINDLAGRFDAARATWQLGPDQTIDWATGLIPCPAEEIQSEIKAASRVYLLIVNAPEECVIGGDRLEVEALLRKLGKAFIPLPAITIAHCEVVRPVADKYRALHLLPTNPTAGIRYYSGGWGRAYDVSSETAADAILAHATNTIDFPRLIESAYADGVRLFVEVGPGNSCSRMIARILGGRPHFARSICVPRVEPVAHLVSVLADLFAEGVDVDFSRLDSDRPEPASISRLVRVPVGGKPFAIPAPPKVSRVASPVASVRATVAPPALPAMMSSPMLASLVATQQALGAAQEKFLQFSEQGAGLLEKLMRFSSQWTAAALSQAPSADQPVIVETSSVLDTEMCREFAAGSIARVLGPEFAPVDSFPTRVRLPDGPLMLVDHVLGVEGKPRSMASGRVVTDHLVHEQRWYILEGHIPTSICVEAGQADLFLSGYLGIDFVTRGLAVYRLLDAVVTFHRPLPRPGERICYDIQIDRFFRQGETHLFRFRFEGTVNGEPLLTMRDGCAGFFTADELAAGRGIVQTEFQKKPMPGQRPEDWRQLVPARGVERYDDRQLEALRSGDVAACFGSDFAGLALQDPLTLPSGMLKLVDRVIELDPAGGRYGLGRIRAEMDIHPDDWFLTCHFVDDMVMPGTLMYECCLHTLRVFLLRMGWIGEKDRVAYEPVPGVASQLKCRGQVTASTNRVTYEVSLKEIGYRPEPYVICDALMYADGKPIVEITNMSLRMSGTTRTEVESIWSRAAPVRQVLFDRDRILAFAIGKPSAAFGDRYRVFDSERVIARLPGPPFQFLDRIVEIQNCRPWQLEAGGEIVAQYDVPPDAWYFFANRQPTMPFAVLLEAALQPCGWLAAYLGSALTSNEDLSFRNLGGKAIQYAPVGPDASTLTTRVKITKVSRSGGMIIQSYDYCVFAGTRKIYEGDTYFGFFTKSQLANQVGIRDAKLFSPPAEQLSRGESFAYPRERPFPDDQLRMIDAIELFIADGGSKGLGFLRGRKMVNPGEWFFKAHFHQDPVWPGSLGLEAFIQLMKVAAAKRWGATREPHVQTLGLGLVHEWVYRGQVIPTNREVSVEVDIAEWDDDRRLMRANGYLSVDGRTIYQMKDFTLQG